MSRFYSPSTRGFYGLFGVAPPPDAIEISDDQHAALMAAQAAGKVITVQGGVVVAVEPSATAEQLRALAGLKLFQVSNGGISVALAGGRIALVDTDAVGRAALLRLQSRETAIWYQSTGSIEVTQQDIAQIVAAVDAHVESALATWTAIVAAIDAGAVTTRAQIETPPAPIPEWPSVSA